MEYVCFRRFKDNAICGKVNIPKGSLLYIDNGYLIYNGDTICSNTSQNCYEYFARNNDGNGIVRGELTQKIIKVLAKRDNNYQKRWDKIWSDMSLLKFKRKEFDDYWLWNHEFYNASINDLEYIYDKIK